MSRTVMGLMWFPIERALEAIHSVHHSFTDGSKRYKIPGLLRAKLVEQKQCLKYCHFILLFRISRNRGM